MTALSRLKQDFVRIKKDPVPYIVAEPLPSNILEWHYVVTGKKPASFHCRCTAFYSQVFLSFGLLTDHK